MSLHYLHNTCCVSLECMKDFVTSIRDPDIFIPKQSLPENIRQSIGFEDAQDSIQYSGPPLHKLESGSFVKMKLFKHQDVSQWTSDRVGTVYIIVDQKNRFLLRNDVIRMIHEMTAQMSFENLSKALQIMMISSSTN